MAAGQAKNRGLPVTCGHHVDLRVPSAARFADALRPVRLSCPGSVGMHLDAAAVEVEAVRIFADRFLLPNCCEQPLEHAAVGSAAKPGVNREPVAEPLRQRTSLAAVLQNIQNRIDEGDVRNPHVPALNREKRVDFGVLFRHDLFHDCAPLDFYVIVDRHLIIDPSKNQAEF